MKRFASDRDRLDRVPAERIYRGQVYQYASYDVIPASDFRRSFTIVRWRTACPECGAEFTVTTTKSKAIRTRDFKPTRRCEAHRQPGIVVEMKPVAKPKMKLVPKPVPQQQPTVKRGRPPDVAMAKWMVDQGFSAGKAAAAVAEARARQILV